MHTVLREPFRIRAVEPIRLLSRAERREKLDRAKYNLFRLSPGDVAIDLLRDSGSGAFTLDRIAALLKGDDGDPGERSASRLESFVRDLTGFRHAVITRQGALAERLAISLLAAEARVVFANALGESARANCRFAGAEPRVLVPADALDAESRRPLRGGLDAAALERAVAAVPQGEAAFVLVSLASDPSGGQSVSIDSLRAASAVCRRHGVPLWLEASRFAENAFLARRDDPALRGRTVAEVAREIFGLADGAYVCGPRDALASAGGFVALNDDALASRCRTLAFLSEGPSAAGSPARDFDALSSALRDGLDETSLAYRQELCGHLAENLEALGVPVLHPSGGDSVFIDAARFLPHLPRTQFPGQALACALFVEGGVRGCEVGSLSLGSPLADGKGPGVAPPAPFELLRLSLPIRGCTEGHVNYVVGRLAALIRQRGEIRGLRVVRDESQASRLYSAELEPVP